MLKDIVEAKPIKDYKLYLKFEDGINGIVDISQLIDFVGIFEKLKDFSYFQTVKVNPEWGTIYWENGADLDPDVLYSLITNNSLPYQTKEASFL